jgi:hypothetical protein
VVGRLGIEPRTRGLKVVRQTGARSAGGDLNVNPRDHSCTNGTRWLWFVDRFVDSHPVRVSTHTHPPVAGALSSGEGMGLCAGGFATGDAGADRQGTPAGVLLHQVDATLS